MMGARDERASVRAGNGDSPRSSFRLGIAKGYCWMGFRWSLPGARSFWRALRQYGKTFRRWTSSLRRWLSRRDHGSWSRRPPQIDGRGNPRNSKMVTRIRMSREQLRRGYESLPPQVRTNAQTESLALGTAVVRGFLGADWLEKHVIPDSSKSGFFTIDESGPHRREMSFFRVIDLAEVLYNLQNIPGFDECIQRMREGNIEGTFAELDFGRMLFLNAVPFRFVVPRGTTGADYDIEVLYPNNVVACADAKCKIETTKFSEKSIRHTLNKARKQLPNNEPGIVFVKVPAKWTVDPVLSRSAIDVARDFLRGTRRVVSVKFYGSPITYTDNVMKVQHAYKEISNPVTDFGNGINWDIFKHVQLPPEYNGMPLHWQRILFYPDGTAR